jgi:TnpA family transposase
MTVEKEWPTVQRIMASLAEKDTTQATIVRKLSSYTRQNQTKKALWELENICRTIYILDFIDDVTLRQRVQKALNRGEAYHRLRRAVAYTSTAGSSALKPRRNNRYGMSVRGLSPMRSSITTPCCCRVCMSKN